MTVQTLQTSVDPRVDRLTRFADQVGRLIPDAMTTSIALLVVVTIAALAMGTTVVDTMGAYHRGLWMLLPFTMQMTLILVLSSSLGASPIFKRVICALSHLPSSVSGVVGASILLTASLSYVYWGLGITLGPLIAVHFARQAERKGLAIFGTACRLLSRHPRPLSGFREAWQLGEEPSPAATAHARALPGWLVYHFAIAMAGSS